MTESSDPSLLIVISAPSGAGKTTLCERLLSEHPNMRYSISCTTREPRPGEVDGEDYLFMDDARFERLVKEDAFLEHAMVHGNRYGTLRETIDQLFENGFDVLLDVDVQGAEQIRTFVETLGTDDALRTGFIDIFIAPPSLEVLRARLEGRAQDSAEVIDHRMKNAEEEMQQADFYAYQVVNDDLDAAYASLRNLIAEKKQHPTAAHPKNAD